MIDHNNTASDLVSAASNVVSVSSGKTDKAPKIRTARETSQDVTQIVLDDAVRAVKESDSANFNFSTSLLAMMLDSLSRKAARGEFNGKAFEPGKDGKLPSGVTKSNGEVMFALMVRCAYKGVPVYLETSGQAAEIAAMPNGSMVKKDGKSTPDAARAAKIKAAREYVDGKYVQNGVMLPVSVTVADLKAGKYPGAKAKAMTSSFATARKMTAFLTKWFWDNRHSFITGLEGRPLTADDIEHVRNIIRDAFGLTFADLESAYRAGRPAPVARGSLLDRLIGAESPIRKELDKASIEDITTLSAFFNNLLAQRSRGVEDAEIAAGLDGIGEDESTVAGYDDEDDSEASDEAVAA